jgi:endonuclease YncB( thermonuclease family)
MKRKRQTPRARLVDLLCEHGFAVCEDDISWVRGAWAHDHFDVTHRWTANVVRVADGKRVEITGRDSITKCAQFGIELEEKPDDLYGDYGASAKTPQSLSL